MSTTSVRCEGKYRVMIYLENFRFPTFEDEDLFLADYFKQNPSSIRGIYPFKVLSVKGLHSLDFTEITVLYGGNGSGKSTAINAISNKLDLVRNSAYNVGDFQEEYLGMCKYQETDWSDGIKVIKDVATLITSDDIFKYMLDTRHRNAEVKADIYNAMSKWYNLRDNRGKVSIREAHLSADEKYKFGYERRHVLNRSEFVKATAGTLTSTYSNGETGYRQFLKSIVPDRLYILDEPENSLSCALQIELAQFIEESAKYLGCQFIIATHSPFLLALKGAKIYNLDGAPATISKFWELPNMKLYYNLFKEYDEKFRF